MGRIRIGELLGRMGKLSEHDIDEILEEQSATRGRFGDIALTWGMCQPEHIWRAWCDQLSDLEEAPERVDLGAVGVDARAVEQVPGFLAWQYQVVPLRSFQDQMVMACAAPMPESAAGELSRHLGKTLRFVHASPAQVDSALRRYYPVMEPAR